MNAMLHEHHELKYVETKESQRMMRYVIAMNGK